MAKSKIERCDKILGKADKADYFMAVASYKAEDETRYLFGVHFTVPAKFKTGDDDVDKALKLWCKRMVSADNAGIPKAIADGNMTADEAEAQVLEYDGENFLVKLNEVKVRTASGLPAGDPVVTFLANILRDKDKQGTLPDTLPESPLTEKGKKNYNAWAKQLKSQEHPWYGVASKEVEKASKKFM
jgi:hypothetical protein